MKNNEIDRPDDIVLLMLQQEDSDKEYKRGMYRGNLYEALQELDISRFKFDETLEEYSEYIDTLEMFDTMGFFSRFRKGSRIALSDKGMKVAETLEENLSVEQENAIITAIAEAR